MIAGFGARPRSIDAEEHDRMLAGVCHLPHVLANVLVKEAQGAMPAPARAFATRRASRGPTRRCGATSTSPTATSSAARSVPFAPSSPRSIERSSKATARGWRTGRRSRPSAGATCWRRRASAARSRRSGSSCRTGLVSLPSFALALGRAGINIHDMSLSPSADNTRGEIAFWVPAGGGQPGPTAVARARERPLRSGGALRGEIEPPADKSISHRAAILGAMASDPVRVHNYLDADDTISTLDAMRALGALVEQRAEELVIRGVGLREAREPEEPIDVGNAGHAHAPAARLAGRAGRRTPTARRRRLDPPAARRPDREPLELMGARSRRPTAACRPSRSTAPACIRSTTSCRSPRRR